MTAKGDAQVFKQWEAPATATVGLNFADRLVSLIKEASQDYVQPQAAKALENLGARCLVSDDLIGQGIDALNGNQSIRLRDTKAFIGLSSGGIAAGFRTSTSCIQAFLLVTALEACGYGESSGYSLKLISVSAAVAVDEVIHALDTLRTLQPNRSTAACWCKLPHEALAEFLVKAFDQLQKDDVNYVEISGSVSLVWIILTLFWLNKDKVGLFHGSTCILGSEGCKIRIQPLLEKTADIEAGASHIKQENWIFKSWVKGEPISQMVKSQDRTNPAYRFDEPGFIPSYLARSYYITRFRSEEAVEALRAVAEAYVAAALETNMKFPDHWPLPEPLSSVIRKEPSQQFFGPDSTLFTRLGWNSKPIPQLNVAALIEKDDLSCKLRMCNKHTICKSSRWAATNYDSTREIEVFLQKCLDSCPQVELGPSEVSKLHEAASSVAAHALIYLFLRLTTQDMPFTKSSTDSVASQPFPLFYEAQTGAIFWETIFELPSHQVDPVVDLARLREAILKTAVVTKSRLLHPEATVAVSASGRTAIIAPIFDHLIKKAGILDVYLISGNIRFHDMTIDNIVEDLDIKEDKSFPRLNVTAMVWNTIHHFPVEGNLLLMRTSVECRASLESSQQQSSQRTVHYTKCVDDIARSFQINERREDTLISQDTRKDADKLGFKTQVWNLLQSHFFSDFSDRKHSNQKSKACQDSSWRNPFSPCLRDRFFGYHRGAFFSCQAEFLPTRLLIIEEDAKLKDYNWKILSQVFHTMYGVEIQRTIEPNLRNEDFLSTDAPASRDPLASRGPLAHRNQPVVNQSPYDAGAAVFSNSPIRRLPSWTIITTS